MNKVPSLLLTGLLFSNVIFAQATEGSPKKEKLPNNWYQQDITDSGYNGISLAKAYDFLKAKKLKPVQTLLTVYQQFRKFFQNQ